MMDALGLRSIVVYGSHGVSEAERAVGRPFEVDVELALDLTEAGARDDLAATVDYAALAEIVRRVNEGGPYRLLETFAARIADQVLARFPVAEVRVRVRKPNPPVGSVVGAAEVEITRAPETTG